MSSFFNFFLNVKDNYIKSIIEGKLKEYLKSEIKLESNKMSEIVIN